MGFKLPDLIYLYLYSNYIVDKSRHRSRGLAKNLRAIKCAFTNKTRRLIKISKIIL